MDRMRRDTQAVRRRLNNPDLLSVVIQEDIFIRAPVGAVYGGARRREGGELNAKMDGGGE